jgi:uncharacterized membrane protein HdeD (DUF308 family)
MSNEALVSEDLHESTRAWWLFMLVGLVSIAAGVIVLAKPANSLATLAVIAGLFVLVDGIFDLMTSLSSYTENRGLAAVLGVLSVVVGILLIRHPFGGVLAIALLVGIWLVSSGVVRLVRSFERDHRMTNMLVALTEVAAGIVLVASPAIAYATLALLVGIAFIADGVATFALGWVMHGLRHDSESPAPLGTGIAT